jgi:hypothetical protein
MAQPDQAPRAASAREEMEAWEIAMDREAEKGREIFLTLVASRRLRA